MKKGYDGSLRECRACSSTGSLCGRLPGGRAKPIVRVRSYTGGLRNRLGQPHRVFPHAGSLDKVPQFGQPPGSIATG